MGVGKREGVCMCVLGCCVAVCVCVRVYVHVCASVHSLAPSCPSLSYHSICWVISKLTQDWMAELVKVRKKHLQAPISR